MGDRGFNFSRKLNQSLDLGAATKTGTTICGVVFEAGVILGADTRSTNGETVADKDCEKIHYIAPNIYCCGAGTAADTESVTGLISSNLLLHRKQTDRPSAVKSALTLLKTTLFRHQGHIGAALVLGGVDSDGSHLFTVYPHGSSDALPYAAMGSGSLAAMATLETGYHEEMSLDAAKNLVTRAILSGVMNDLGSGSNVDLCVITRDSVQYLRNDTSNMHRTFRISSKFDDRQEAVIDYSHCGTATRVLHAN